VVAGTIIGRRRQVSESRGDGQPEGSSPPNNNSGQPSSSNGQPKTGNSEPKTGNSQPKAGSSQPKAGNGQPRGAGNGQSGSGRGPSRGSDPVADFQRWLMKAGARSMANQVAGQVKRTLGAERRYSGDVWDTATNEPPPSESPECQWCPVCQAARAARLGSGGDLGARLADAGGALASVVQGAFSAFEQAMKTQDQNQNRSTERSGSSRPDSGAPDQRDTGQ
jgi:hypothetical protein